MCACRSLSQKRKSSEYHDPDYQNTIDLFCNSKRRCEEQINSSPLVNRREKNQSVERISHIISQEFQREIDLRQRQLEDINNRLNNVFEMIDSLRYVLVADYYKQNQFLTTKDMNGARDDQSLFKQESSCVQWALHPSLKRIIGKKPKTYKDILRMSPMSSAFQTAETISMKSQHTTKPKKLFCQRAYKNSITNSSKEQIRQKFTQPSQYKTEYKISRAKCPNRSTPTKILNAARLNNKTRFLILVGNTSKYIGSDIDEQNPLGKERFLTHKWLIYLQAKDSNVPFDRFVKKVRFFLHSSYRPNDVVDIYYSPFQLARLGWGEFSVRIQIFFMESLQQKPIQFVHNLVLDKTLSGLQTLGSETLVEIWLRSDQISSYDNCTDISLKDATHKNPSPSLAYSDDLEAYKSLHSEKSDKNISEFFKNSQKTLTSINVERQSISLKIGKSLPEKDNNAIEMENTQKQAFRHISAACDEIDMLQSTGEHLGSDNELNLKTNIGPRSLNTQTSLSETSFRKQKCMNADIKPNDIKDNKSIFGNIAVLGHIPLLQSSSTNQIPKQKMGQLVDSSGSVKYTQMYIATSRIANIAVATSASTTPIHTESNLVDTRSAIQANLHQCFRNDVKISSTTTKSHLPTIGKNAEGPITKSPLSKLKLHSSANAQSVNSTNNKQSGNVVFLREGKIYIIDPMQVKLKQQQKKQISLLKPQFSFLKKNLNSQTPSICDHDYVPVPTIQPTAKEWKQNYAKEILNAQQFNAVNPFHNEKSSFESLHQQFEREFSAEKFTHIRQGVEYLLRRLPLIGKCTVISTDLYPIINNSLQHFNALSVFKQKCCEWLRSKFIANILTRNEDVQKSCQRLNPFNEVWTTREIVIFARSHAYTPPITNKMQYHDSTQNLKKNESQKEITRFTELIKRELKNDDDHHFDTTTKNCRIKEWAENISRQQSLHDVMVAENKMIEIINLDYRPKYRLKQNNPHALCDGNIIMYLSCPDFLFDAFELVSKICKDAGIYLQHEELACGLIYPATQTLLSTCLRLFVEKLLRLALGFKAYKYPSETITADSNSKNYIEPQDIGNVINSLKEFDFLSNCHLGT